MTFLQQPSCQLTNQTNQQIAITQASQTYEMRATPTNLTTFQANSPLTTFQASDKSSISPASSSLGYNKDSPIFSTLGRNSSSIYNEKLSPSSSTVAQTTPLVYNNSSSSPILQELTISAFNNHYSHKNSDNANGSGADDSEYNYLNSDLNPQWEFTSPSETTNYTILNDWAPGRDYLIDDFTTLGFRPQDEITTEL